MESTPTKNLPIFGKQGSQKGQKKANETAKHVSNPPKHIIMLKINLKIQEDELKNWQMMT